MKLTKEHFDEAIKELATKSYVEDRINEVLLHLFDAMANIEEGLEPEERLALIEQKLNRIQDIMHIEV